jgi:hypothetical protein
LIYSLATSNSSSRDVVSRTIEYRCPPFVAPRHPRLDHIAYYFGLGFVADDIGSTVPSGGRHYHYQHPRGAGYRRLAYCLMQRDSPVLDLFANNPFKGESPPTLMRIRAYNVLINSISEFKRTGKYWDKRLFATYMEPFSVDDEAQSYANLPPLHWHPEDYRYYQDSYAYQQLVAPIRTAAALVFQASPDHTVAPSNAVTDLAIAMPRVGRDCIDALQIDGITKECITNGSWARIWQVRSKLMNATNVATSPHFTTDPFPLIGDKRWNDSERGWLAVRHIMMTCLRPWFDAHKGYEPRLWLQRDDDSKVLNTTQEGGSYRDGSMSHSEWHLALLIDFIAVDGGKQAIEAVWAKPSLAKDYAARMNHTASNISLLALDDLCADIMCNVMWQYIGYLVYTLYHAHEMWLQALGGRIVAKISEKQTGEVPRNLLPGTSDCIDWLHWQPDLMKVEGATPEQWPSVMIPPKPYGAWTVAY